MVFVEGATNFESEEKVIPPHVGLTKLLNDSRPAAPPRKRRKLDTDESSVIQSPQQGDVCLLDFSFQLVGCFSATAPYFVYSDTIIASPIF